MSWLALDIGGANLKIADGHGFANSIAFPLWKHPDQLSGALREILAQAPPANSLAITMTGELADCFETKSEGVASILDSVEQISDGRNFEIYLCNGQFVSSQVARENPLLASASNWRVLATFVGRYLNNNWGLLVDIGSTTTDLVPFGLAGSRAEGTTDPDRLACGELVYTGVQRSPICAIVSKLAWQGNPCRVAQELFATTQDAYLVLDNLQENPSSCNTADGRPFTKAYSHARLARTLCADTTMYSWADAVEAAAIVCRTQLDMISASASQVIERQKSPPRTVVISGQGEFLARQLIERLQLDCEIVSLSAQLGPEVSCSACAHALAVLAQERAEA